MMSELLKQIQNGRLAIDELDHFYIEAKRVIAICEKIRSLFFPESLRLPAVPLHSLPGTAPFFLSLSSRC